MGDSRPDACNLVETASFEIGPALLLPDGRVFAIVATGNTSLYTLPAVATNPGTWANVSTAGAQSNAGCERCSGMPLAQWAGVMCGRPC